MERKIISLEDRIPKLKKMRKRKANRRLILLLTIFFILVGVIIYLQSPLSHVQSIQVSGNTYLRDTEIIEWSGFEKNDNFWDFKSKRMESTLEKHSEIEQAKVVKSFPNKVALIIREYKRIAYVQKDKLYYPVLENGSILKNGSENLPVYAPVLMGFKEGKEFESVINQLEQLPEVIRNSISELHNAPKKTDKYHITIYMNDGYEVSASGKDFSEKLVHYPAIISQLEPGAKGIIDLEVGSFFRSYETIEKQKDEEATKTNEGEG